MKDHPPQFMHVFYLPVDFQEAAWLVNRNLKVSQEIFVVFLVGFAAMLIVSSQVTVVNLTPYSIIVGALAVVAFWFKRREDSHNEAVNLLAARPYSYFSLESDLVKWAWLSGGYLTFPWKAVSYAFALPNSITLVIQNELYPIPRRTFASAAAVDDFLALLKAKKVRIKKVGKAADGIAYGVGQVFPDLETMQDAMDERRAAIKPEYEDSFETTGCESWEELIRIDNLLYLRYQLPVSITVNIVLVSVLTAGVYYGGHYLKLAVEFSQIAILGLVGGVLSSLYTGWKKRRDQLKANFADFPVFYDLSESGCTLKSRSGNVPLPWQDFTMCLTTPEFYVAFFSVGSVVIPRRLLSRSSDAYVCDILRRKIDKQQAIS